MENSPDIKSATTSTAPLVGSSHSAAEKIAFDDALQFIIKVGLAAHKYGSTASRLQSFLVSLSSKFCYCGVFRSTPSEIIFALR
ncbi:hypothetical protein [Shewanella sp. 0m-4]